MTTEQTHSSEYLRQEALRRTRCAFVFAALAAAVLVMIVLNINTPDLPAEEIRGVMTARLGESFYRDHFELVQGEEYKLVGLERDQTHLGEDIDVNLNRQHYATVTPLLCDFTEHRLLSLVREWGFRL